MDEVVWMLDLCFTSQQWRCKIFFKWKINSYLIATLQKQELYGKPTGQLKTCNKKWEILESQILGHPFLQGSGGVGSISVGREGRRCVLHMTAVQVFFMNREVSRQYHVGNIPPLVHPSAPSTWVSGRDLKFRQWEAELSLVTRDISFTMWKADRERQMALNAGFT